MEDPKELDKVDTENLDDNSGKGLSDNSSEIEKEEHKERSNLGRKVSDLERLIASSKTETNMALEAILDRLDSLSKQENEDYLDKLDDVDTITKADLPKITDNILSKIEQREAEKKKLDDKYQSDFASTFITLQNKENEDLAEAIEIELLENFNNRVTGNPVADARINFAEAKAAVLAKVSAGKLKDNPLSKNIGKQYKNLGGGVKTNMKESGLDDIKLTPLEEEYIRITGMKKESILKTLGKA